MPNISIGTVVHRLRSFMAPQRRSLIEKPRTRIPVVAPAQVLDQQEYERVTAYFMLLRLQLDDVNADGSITLKRSFDFSAIKEFGAREKAVLDARELAALRSHPYVVINGAFEPQSVAEEPDNLGRGLSIYRTNGQVFDRRPSKHDDSIAEDCTLLHSSFRRKLPAVGHAKKLFSALKCRGNEPPLVYVCDEDTREIIWTS